MLAFVSRGMLRRLSALCLVIFGSALLFGQGAKLQSQTPDPDADHPLQREQWFLHGRKLPGGTPAATLHYRAYVGKMNMRALRSASAHHNASPLAQPMAAASGWKPLGPAPLASDASGIGFQDYGWVSGRATAVAIDPADATGNTVYVGGAYGGLWRSQNAASGSFGNASGITWTPLIDDQATLAVGAIAIQPGAAGALSNIVLVGTGEANSSTDSYYGLGILRSTDAGNTWSLISTANGGALSFGGLGAARMAFSSAQPNTVVAAMGTSSVGAIDGLITSNTQRGLYTSTDAGQSWSWRVPQDPGGPINPSTSATSVVYNAGAGRFFAVVRYHGFYSSPDGLTWTRLANQPGGAALSTAACPTNYLAAGTIPTCPIYRGEIAVVPGRNEMYIWYVSLDFATAQTVDQGIWKSTDGGTTWIAINDSGITNCGDGSGCGVEQGTYNLALTAVPNGSTATDLYAAAINVYKCSINNTLNPTCNTNPFINLTHVYGCGNPGAPAHVHPDQHDMNSVVVNGKALLYFANDGGIYRTLDGFAGLASGSCAATNQFDSLNGTLGSMTQFVAFSQHPTDPNTLLGGTQDNGSPATGSSQTSSLWGNVNSGDGGYNAINPNNPNEWFTANFDVSIQRCALGLNCRSGDFSLVVDSSTLGGDAGPFYTPYILDPQSTGAMLVGTCRVWRGASSGAGFTALSDNFDTNTGAICTGRESNLVRSLSAGGPKDANGLSNVIYAGTDGIGTPPPGTPAGGHLWVSTNAAGGSGTWVERTQSINPGNFPISGVAIDTSDPTGQTAYVTIMGFHVSHVWKTSDAGQTWMDFTGNLPDAPVNAVIVDSGANPASGTVYVGTDVGVFFASSGSPTPLAWTELGPAPSGSQNGYLPNVAVTALDIFRSGPSKKLRASTYGRGVWEFDLVAAPDYYLSVPHASQIVFPNQTASFSGTVTAAGGYNSQVALSCAAGSTAVPGTCAANPSAMLPANATAFTVTAAGAIGDYSFNLHAVGSDANTITHNLPLTLHVVDFGLGAPSSATVSVNRPASSQAVTFQVTALGSFSSTVTLACSGLPAGSTCIFSPGASVNPASGSPVSVSLIINTSTSTPVGTFPITISANTGGAPASKTTTLSLTVTALADYSLILNNNSASAIAGAQATLNGVLTAFNGYNSAVNLSCGAGAPATCQISSTSLTPSPAGVQFMVTLSSSMVRSYSFSLVAQGTDPSAISHSVAATFDSTFDFSVVPGTASQSVRAGQVASYNLDFIPAGGTFPNVVSLTCSGAPSRSTCTLNPAQIATGAGNSTVVLSVATTAPIASVQPRTRALFYALAVPLPGLLLFFAGFRSSQLCRRQLMIVICLLGVLLLTGSQLACAGGSSGGGAGPGVSQPGTPAGTYTITVTAASGGLTHSTTVTLDVLSGQ